MWESNPKGTGRALGYVVDGQAAYEINSPASYRGSSPRFPVMASETQVERWFREFGPTPLEETMFSASHRENLSSKIRGDYDNIFIVWPETNPGASSLTVGLSHEPFVAHVNNDPESVVKEYVEYNDLLERNSSWCIHCNLMRLNIPDEVKAASRRFLRSEDADGWNNAGGDDGEAGWERPKSL